MGTSIMQMYIPIYLTRLREKVKFEILFCFFLSLSVTQFDVHIVNAIVCFVCVMYTALVSGIKLVVI